MAEEAEKGQESQDFQSRGNGGNPEADEGDIDLGG